MLLYVQRTARHLPHPAQCLLVARDSVTLNGVIYMFNPITGEAVEYGLVRTNYKIDQALLMNKMNEEFLRPLLVLDEKQKVHVYPENATAICPEIAKQTFIFTANTDTGVLTGFTIDLSSQVCYF